MAAGFVTPILAAPWYEPFKDTSVPDSWYEPFRSDSGTTYGLGWVGAPFLGSTPSVLNAIFPGPAASAAEGGETAPAAEPSVNTWLTRDPFGVGAAASSVRTALEAGSAAVAGIPGLTTQGLMTANPPDLAATGGGAGGGGLTAAEQAQRDLWLRQQQQNLGQDLRDILSQYRPALTEADTQIARQRAAEEHDLGVYTRLMTALPHSYERAGALTDKFYRQAQRAVAEQDVTARGQINASFASATGRVRAMVLAVSHDSPQTVDALTRGLDEIADHIDRGMVMDKAGWDQVIAASHRLADIALQYSSAQAVGEQARTAAQTRIQYQNAIDSMLIERQALVDAREEALQRARENAALNIQQQQEQWALADALAAARGGGGGAAASQPGAMFWPENTPTTAAEYYAFALSGLVSNETLGVDDEERQWLVDEIATAQSLGFRTYAEYYEYLTTDTSDPTRPALTLNAADQNAIQRLSQYDAIINEGLSHTYDLAMQEWQTTLAEPQGGPLNTFNALRRWALDMRYDADGWGAGSANEFAATHTYNDLVAVGRAPAISGPTVGAQVSAALSPSTTAPAVPPGWTIPAGLHEAVAGTLGGR